MQKCIPLRYGLVVKSRAFAFLVNSALATKQNETEVN